MTSISSHSNESGNSAESRSSDQDSVALHQSGDIPSLGRFVRLIIYEQGEKNGVRRIWIYEQSTYGDIGRSLEEEDPTVSYAILQPIWGPRPHWTEADPNTSLGGTCRVLYAVVKKEESRYILGVLRTPTSDYPIPIYDETCDSSRTVSQAVMASHPGLTGQIKSIISYPDNEDLKDSQYSYDSLKRYQPSVSPAVIVTLGEPPSELVTNLSDRQIPPILQRPFMYCKRLIEQAYDLNSFALQMIHLTSALLHTIISLAKATESVLAKDGPNVDEALDADEGLADSLRVTPIIARNLEELLNTFERIMGNIHSGKCSHTEIQDLIEALFGALCDDYPGAVVIRHSYRTFQELSQVDREEEARNLARPESDIRQFATASAMQPVITTTVTEQVTMADVSTRDELPNIITPRQLIGETLRGTDVSLQHGRNQPQSPIPIVESSRDKGKDKGRPPEEPSRSLQAAFTRKLKVVTPRALSYIDDKPLIESTHGAGTPLPVSPSPSSPRSSSASSSGDEEEKEREGNREQVGKQLKGLEKMMSSQLLGFARPKGDPTISNSALEDALTSNVGQGSRSRISTIGAVNDTFFNPVPPEELHANLQFTDEYMLPKNLFLIPSSSQPVPSTMTATGQSVVAPGPSIQPQAFGHRLQCETCGKRFDRSARVEACRNRHQGLKPHLCRGVCGSPGCLKRYASIENLSRHLSRFAQCRSCGKQVTKQRMARHIKSCSTSLTEREGLSGPKEEPFANTRLPGLAEHHLQPPTISEPRGAVDSTRLNSRISADSIEAYYQERQAPHEILPYMVESRPSSVEFNSIESHLTRDSRQSMAALPEPLYKSSPSFVFPK